MYKGFTFLHFESLFTLGCNNKGTRGHLAKLSKPRCQKDVRKYFSYRVINRWNALDDDDALFHPAALMHLRID